MRTSLLLGLIALGLAGGCRQPAYMRHPLARDAVQKPGAPSTLDLVSPVDPYAPPRPILPDEPSRLVIVPMIKSLERTPANNP